MKKCIDCGIEHKRGARCIKYSTKHSTENWRQMKKKEAIAKRPICPSCGKRHIKGYLCYKCVKKQKHDVYHKRYNFIVADKRKWMHLISCFICPQCGFPIKGCGTLGRTGKQHMIKCPNCKHSDIEKKWTKYKIRREKFINMLSKFSKEGSQ